MSHSKKKPKAHAVHDKFFRAAMEHKSIAIDFIRHHFPAKITASLNTDTLQLLKQSYIDNDLQESLSDLVFHCELADKPAYLTLLVEHQSTAEKLLPFRVRSPLPAQLS